MRNDSVRQRIQWLYEKVLYLLANQSGGNIPTNTSDISNNGSDGTSTYVEHDEIGTAATSNDYNDLDNIPPPSPSNFIELVDTENSYSGKKGEKLIVNDTEDEVIFSTSKIITDRYETSVLNNFSYPEWFGGVKVPVNYANGKFETDFDVEKVFEQLILTETPYYVSPNGVNTNDGLSMNTPVASVSRAGILGAKLIYMMEGVYNAGSFISTASSGFEDLPNGDIAVIGLGNVKVTGHRTTAQQTFTDEGGGIFKTNTYASNVDSVVDLEFQDEKGYDKLYEQVDTLLECQNNVYTWFYDTVNSEVYLNIGLNRVLVNGGNVAVNATALFGIRSDYGKAFFKNLEFMDRFYVTGKTSASEFSVYMKDVKMLQPKNNGNGAVGYSGFEINSASAYLQNCVSRNASRDGFTYTDSFGSENIKILELDCTSIFPSFGQTGQSNQASSAHSGMTITRINGLYDGGSASVIRDVTEETQSVLIGCTLIQENDVDETVTSGCFAGVDAYLFACSFYGQTSITALSESVLGVTLEKCLLPNNSLLTGNVVIVD